MRKTLCWLLFIPVSAVWGCGKGPQMTEPQGIVKFKGKPIDRMQIEFLPDPDKKTKGARSTGVSDGEGRFQLQSDDGYKGVVVGHHRVIIRDLKTYGDKISFTRPSEAEAAKFPPSRIPMAYADAGKTPLRMEITPGQKQIELVIDAKAGD